MEHGRLELQAGRAAQLLGERPANGVDDVHLAALERGQPRGLVGDDLEDEPANARPLAPVLIERLQHDVHPRRGGDELVGARAHRRLLEAVLANLLDVFLGNDPARPGGRRVEGEEIRPRLLQAEPNACGIHDLDGGHAFFQRPGGGAAVAVERELHVLRGDRLPVVEAGAAAEDELVRERVLRDGPGLGEARRQELARHGLGEGIVQRVVDHVRRDDPRRLRGIEPGRSEHDVHAPRDLIPLRRDLAGRRHQERHGGGDDRDGRAERSQRHDGFLIGNAGGTIRSTVAPSQRQPETWLQYCSVARRAFA